MLAIGLKYLESGPLDAWRLLGAGTGRIACGDQGLKGAPGDRLKRGGVAADLTLSGLEVDPNQASEGLLIHAHDFAHGGQSVLQR